MIIVDSTHECTTHGLKATCVTWFVFLFRVLVYWGGVWLARHGAGLEHDELNWGLELFVVFLLFLQERDDVKQREDTCLLCNWILIHWITTGYIFGFRRFLNVYNPWYQELKKMNKKVTIMFAPVPANLSLNHIVVTNTYLYLKHPAGPLLWRQHPSREESLPTLWRFSRCLPHSWQTPVCFKAFALFCAVRRQASYRAASTAPSIWLLIKQHSSILHCGLTSLIGLLVSISSRY